MKIRRGELVFDGKNPFEGDLLDRENEIRNLDVIIDNAESPFVMAVDAPWGAGKTTFIRMWSAYLERLGRKSIYFSAWETDFANDPMIPFLSEIGEGLEAILNEGDEEFESWNKAKEVGKVIAKRGLPAAIKLLTLGMVNDEINAALSEMMKEASEDLIDFYDKQKNAIFEFKSNLEKVLNGLEGGRLVIFIDELDRCRPDYSILLLERIKHIFNIEGLVFVLSVAKTQLLASFKAVYGTDLDSEQYQKRFFDIDYQLRKPKIHNYINSLYQEYDMNRYLPSWPGAQFDVESEFKISFSIMVERFSVSLREMDQVIARLSIIMRAFNREEQVSPVLVMVLLFLKIKREDLFYEYMDDNDNGEKVMIWILDHVSKEFRYTNVGCMCVEANLLAGKLIEGKHGSLQEKVDGIISNDGEDHAKRSYYNTVRQVSAKLGRHSYINLDDLADKVALLSRVHVGE